MPERKVKPSAETAELKEEELEGVVGGKGTAHPLGSSLDHPQRPPAGGLGIPGSPPPKPMP